ncbi:MAG: nitronate monooxygenase [Acidobacteriota bacterium]|nr:nitronate monooxygenase [Acidobacteriota bacterium]MDH3523706.1 nitronate monooxygenase [Acidobacteriota bacterium]
MTRSLATPFTRHAGVAVPLIGGPMYPCSNPELVAAVSAAGGLGVVQPVSLTYVHGHGFREGIRYIRSLTDKPIGMNALIEASSKKYFQRMSAWIDVALEEGVRFFITSLGNPRWVVERVHAVGGVVYHDVTSAKWAEKGLAGGVDGLIAVNRRAGGHAGDKSPEELFVELSRFEVPLVCAGGVASGERFAHAIRLGYAAVQIGTRLIATRECTAAEPYKQAIVGAGEEDIVLSERLTGVPVAVIDTPYVRRMGLRASPFERWMLRGRRRKHWMRMAYALKSLWQLKRASLDETGRRDYWQAGKSAGDVHSIVSVREIVDELAAALEALPARVQ